MKSVFSVDDIPWKNLKDLPGARGFEYKIISDGRYSSAFNSELVRLQPGDHSIPHVETWSHLLYFVTGTGEITIKDETTPISPGTVALVKAGERHSLCNLGSDDMMIVAVYDPPRTRAD